MATVSLKADRLVGAPAAQTLAAIRKPSEFPHWVPGVRSIENEDGAGNFTCQFHFSVFNLKFKVTMSREDGATTKFSTSAVIIGKVEARVRVTETAEDESQVAVELQGLLRSAVMQRMALSLFEKGADVISQRLNAYLATRRAA